MIKKTVAVVLVVLTIFFSMNSLPGTAGSEIQMPYVVTEFPVAKTSEVEEPALRQISQPSQIRLYFPDERLVVNFLCFQALVLCVTRCADSAIGSHFQL